MLRTSLRSVRALGSRPVAAAAARQWHIAVARQTTQRYYADERKPVDPETAKPAVLPASLTNTSPATPATPSTPKPPTVSAAGVPLTPPAPETVAPLIDKATTPPPPPTATTSAPRQRPGFFRRLRNYVLTLTVLGVLAFGGGVWYSRVNDNFHDFFTEYVPYGEQAVLYLEEMDFRKRVPKATGTRAAVPAQAVDAKINIPAQSGASWRVADGGESSGRQSSAVGPQDGAAKKKQGAPQEVAKAKKETETLPKAGADVTESKKAEKTAAVADKQTPTPPPVVAPEAKAKPAFVPPEVDEPSRWPPASPIDPLSVNDAAEPVVQDLVRMLNDIITTVNHDGANERYGATIGKAKEEVNKVGRKIHELKTAVEREAATAVQARVNDFDRAANELLTKVETAMAAHETAWRREFEDEMRRVKEAHDAQLATATQRERELGEARAANRLLEQAVELQRSFAREVRQQVEQEREARLGRLGEVATAVSELEALVKKWNGVVDASLQTQQLHVAVEAVRASLQDAQHPRPFVRELVALRETAAEDEVVAAAIASINPSAYQRGVATPGELVDRFRRVAGEVRKASLLPEDAGVASHAGSWVLSKVLFAKSAGAASARGGDEDVESVLARTQALLEEGDLDGAAREMNTLGGWAKVLSRDWLGEVRKVLEVRQALEVIQTEARLQSLRVE